MEIPTASPQAIKLLIEGMIALSQIEANGIRIHTKRLAESIQKAERKANKIENKLRSDPLFQTWRKIYGQKATLESTQQLAKIVFDHLGYECKVTTNKGDKSASEKSLQDVDIPFVKNLFEMKKLRKAVSTYLGGFQREIVDGLIHPSFNLHTTVSFRSSSDSPNFQNIPRRNEKISQLIRSCIIPPNGEHFWEIDFKGSEVSINASINKDPVLLDYVRTDPGRMHKDAASDLFMIPVEKVIKRVRDRAKNQFVFASFYGSYYAQTAKNLWEDVCRDKSLTVGEDGPWLKDYLASKGIKELGECDPKQRPKPKTFEDHVRKVDEMLWNRFSVYKKWREDWWADYQKNGYFVTPTGFVIQWGKGGVLSRNDAISYPAQGCSFHCLLWFMTRLQKWLVKHRMRTKIVGQIHDSMEGHSPPEEIQDVFDKASEIVAVDLPKYFPWILAPMLIEIETAPLNHSWYRKRLWEKQNGVWGPKE